MLWLEQESLKDLSSFFSHPVSLFLTYSQTPEVIIIPHQPLFRGGENYLVGFACTVLDLCVNVKQIYTHLFVSNVFLFNAVVQLYISNSLQVCIRQFMPFPL